MKGEEGWRSERRRRETINRLEDERILEDRDTTCALYLLSIYSVNLCHAANAISPAFYFH